MKARASNVKHARGKAARSRRAETAADKRVSVRRVAPAVVLVNPQLGENIGFAARALANFGLSGLRLVEPRDGWPNDRAHAAAAGAAFVVETATVYPSVEAAIEDLNFVLATTARPREMVKPVLSPESAARALVAVALRGERSGILFGPERSGLDNDAIALADAIVIAPVSQDFASLSLPQAVLILAYEWLKAQGASPALGRVTCLMAAKASHGLEAHCLMPSEMRRRSASTSRTITSTSSPSWTTLDGLTFLLVQSISDTCTRPSTPGSISTNAP